MAIVGSIPRRCVNLPAGSLRTLIRCTLSGKLQEGPAIEEFYKQFGDWLGGTHVFGAASGRSAFQLALEALNQAGQVGGDILLVLNDNRMSISPSVGALSSMLNRLRTADVYQHAKREARGLLKAIPVIGRGMEAAAEHVWEP